MFTSFNKFLKEGKRNDSNEHKTSIQNEQKQYESTKSVQKYLYMDILSVLLCDNKINDDFSLQLIIPTSFLRCINRWLNENTQFKNFDIKFYKEEEVEQVCRYLQEQGDFECTILRILINIFGSHNFLKECRSVQAALCVEEALRLSNRLCGNNNSNEQSLDQVCRYGWFGLMKVHISVLFCGMLVYEQIGQPEVALKFSHEAINILKQSNNFEYSSAPFQTYQAIIDLKRNAENPLQNCTQLLQSELFAQNDGFTFTYLKLKLMIVMHEKKKEDFCEEIKSKLENLKRLANQNYVDCDEVFELVKELELESVLLDNSVNQNNSDLFEQFPRIQAKQAIKTLQTPDYSNMPKVFGFQNIKQNEKCAKKSCRKTKQCGDNLNTEMSQDQKLVCYIRLLHNLRECPVEFKELSKILSINLSMVGYIHLGVLLLHLANFPSVPLYIQLQHQKVKVYDDHQYLLENFFEMKANSLSDYNENAKSVLEYVLSQTPQMSFCSIHQVLVQDRRYLIVICLEMCWGVPLMICVDVDDKLVEIEASFKDTLKQDIHMFSEEVKEKSAKSKKDTQEWWYTRRKIDLKLKEILEQIQSLLGPWICICSQKNNNLNDTNTLSNIYEHLTQQQLPNSFNHSTAQKQIYMHALQKLLLIDDSEQKKSLLKQALIELNLLTDQPDADNVVNVVLDMYRTTEDQNYQFNNLKTPGNQIFSNPRRINSNLKYVQQQLDFDDQKFCQTPVFQTPQQKQRTPRISSMRNDPIQNFDQIRKQQYSRSGQNTTKNKLQVATVKGVSKSLQKLEIIEEECTEISFRKQVILEDDEHAENVSNFNQSFSKQAQKQPKQDILFEKQEILQEEEQRKQHHVQNVSSSGQQLSKQEQNQQNKLQNALNFQSFDDLLQTPAQSMQKCSQIEWFSEKVQHKKTSQKNVAFQDAAQAQSMQQVQNAADNSLVLILDECTYKFPWERIFQMKSDVQKRFYRNLSLDIVLLQQLKQSEYFVDIDQTYYLVNPEGDLTAAQNSFLQNFENIQAWKGDVGTPCPPANYLLQQLQNHQLFIYCGHGSGGQHLSMTKVSQLSQGPACMLMGCGSVGLIQQGDYDASGAIIPYTSAGCGLMIGNLWDVSDMDLNRFTVELLKRWTSKRCKGDLQTSGVADEVAESRKVCKLQHLTAGASVVVGIPTKIT